MPGKPSKIRYKAIQEDVNKRVTYAGLSGDHTNPYDSSDKRHKKFQYQLASFLFWDEAFDDMMGMYGGSDQLVRRKAVHPGPVKQLNEF